MIKHVGETGRWSRPSWLRRKNAAGHRSPRCHQKAAIIDGAPIVADIVQRFRQDQYVLLILRIVQAGFGQGIAAQAMPLSNPDILDLLPEPNSDGVVLVLDQISDPRNVGAILRSAAAFNALGVVMQDRHAPPEGGALAKAASGALETVPLIRINNLARCLEQLAEMGFWRHGLAMGEGNALSETSLTGKVALVLGAEGTGLRPLTQKNCDTLVHLPMAPAMESLNVSATAAIALFLTYQAMTGGSVTGN